MDLQTISELVVARMPNESNNPQFDKILECQAFPTLPVIAMEILEMTESADVSMNEIGRVVENDPALSVKILKTVNSSFYGLSKPCPTIGRAITYLGLQVVKSLVLGFSIVDTFSDDRFRTEGFDLEKHWRFSLYSAVAARQIAQQVPSVEEDQAFTVGLVSGIGILASALALKDEYGTILQSVEHPWSEKLREAENAAHGFDYIDVSSAFAQRWKFPESYVNALNDSKAPQGALRDGQPFALVIHHALRGGLSLVSSGDPQPISRKWKALPSDLNLDESARDDIVESTLSGARELAKLFQLPDDPSVYSQISARAIEAVTQHQLQVARENEQMQAESVTDGLTQLSNRKHFDSEVQAAHTDAVDNGTPYSVMFFDADRFKSVNDTWGHQAGDLVLQELAVRTSKAAGEMGKAFRYGGEEFCVLCRGIDLKDATTLAESIRATIAAKTVDIAELELKKSELPITVSIGVASFSGESERSSSEVVHAADLGVYAAKEAGRNQVHTSVFEEGAPEGVRTAYASGPGRDESIDAAVAGDAALKQDADGLMSDPNKVHILIVEDDKLQAKLFALPLRGREDFVVEVANSATEAIKIINNRRVNNQSKFHLVMTDLNMPGMSGTDLLRNLKSTRGYETTTFLVLTASEDDRTTKECIEAGATAVITKQSICDRPKQRVLELIEAWIPASHAKAQAA